MDPHPLANLFKRSTYDEPIASELSALDYLYEVLLEIRESENCDEYDACYSYGHDANTDDAYDAELAIVSYVKNEIIAIASTLDSSLIEKHDCNGVIINSINVNHANDMQNHKLGDAMFDEFAMTTTYCNDHDWGDNVSYDLENLFEPHDEYDIESGFGRVSTLGLSHYFGECSIL